MRNGKPPLVSVIVPVYNHQDFVGPALDSIFSQSYPRVEIIAVDDGSEDDSLQVLRQKLIQSPYPMHILEQANRGAHAAINKGISTSTGDYLAILNSDDQFHPQRLAVLVEALEGGSSRFAYSKIKHINGQGKALSSENPYRFYYQRSLEHARLFPTPSFELLRHNVAVSTGNFVFHRDLWHEVGPFFPYQVCHDWDYLLRVILLEEPCFIDQELYNYRIHDRNTLKNSGEVRALEIDEVISSYLSRMTEAKNSLAPSPQNWEVYWYYFVSGYMTHYLAYEEAGERIKWEEENSPLGNLQKRLLKGVFGISHRILGSRWDLGEQVNQEKNSYKKARVYRRLCTWIHQFLLKKDAAGDTQGDR